MNQYLYSIWFLLAGAGISTSSTLNELFSQLDNNNTHKIQSDIINNEYNSVLCWLETINLVQYRNGTNTTDRQFSIILESPGNLSNVSIDKNGSDEETKKSKVHKFSTFYAGKKFNITVNKTLLCGTSKIITKEYTRWASNKQRIQINLGTEKLLEKYNLKTNDAILNQPQYDIFNDKSDNSSIINDTLLFTNEKFVNLSKKTCKNCTKRTTKKTLSKPQNLKSNKNNKRRVSRDDSPNHNVGSNEIQETLKNFSNGNFIKPLNCNFQHKISIKVQLIVEHLVIDTVTDEDYWRIPLESVEKRQDFNIKLDQRSRFKGNEGDVNKCWERLVKLLSREYFMDYFDAVIPFFELPPSSIEKSTNSFGEVITFDEEVRGQLKSAHEYMQECGRQLENRK